jgi:L-alanine-DL-glutamate epimerase-like enolase superfamily enzyme
MRITDVEPIILRLPEVDVTRADGTQDAFLVRVHTDEGIVGIGEADTSPYLARMAIEMPSSHAISRGLKELLLGEDPLDAERLWQRLYEGSSYYGRSALAIHAISAVDIALWDIAGKAAGKPISELLGGRRAEAVRVYASEVMPDTPEAVRAIAERVVASGYRALKLGWGPLGRDLAYDEQLVRAAREVLGPDRDLMLDGGQAYTVARAAELLERVADAGLYWLEEPFAPDDYDSYARLAERAGTRLAAGEADTTYEPFRRLVEHGRVDVLQPDVARCGGFTVARRVLELARERGVEVVPHCFSTGVLVTASLHVAASSARPTYSEFSVAESPLAGGLLTEPFELLDGTLAVPAGPGLGIELDEDAIERLRVR